MSELEIALGVLLSNNIINTPEYWIDVAETGVVDPEYMQTLILNMASYVDANPPTAEMLKRWNGLELVPVVRVTRIEVVGGSGSSSGILDHPKYGRPTIPPSKVPTINASSGLDLNYSYELLD